MLSSLATDAGIITAGTEFDYTSTRFIYFVRHMLFNTYDIAYSPYDFSRTNSTYPPSSSSIVHSAPLFVYNN